MLFVDGCRADKSESIFRGLKKRKVELNKIKRFYVCGAYTDACVSATVEGLRNVLPDVEIRVLSKYCYTHGEAAQEFGIREMKQFGAKII